MDHKAHKKYISKKIGLDLVIIFLLNLKIQGKDDIKILEPLINQIKQDFRRYGRTIVPYVSGYEITVNELVLAVDKINNALIVNDNKNEKYLNKVNIK